MDILQIVTLGLVATILYITLKDINGSFAFFIIIITGIIIFISIVHQIGTIFQLLQSLGEKANVKGMYMETILKIIGISYIAELGASISKDAGLQSVASYIELAGKIFILLLAVPIITAVIEAILGFLPAT
ncbi:MULTISPECIES: stage III sporulation protein AD [Virgibacillus]|jgi:stage III sporulation protein AD|uniref:Stage III sporulation protein AD n=1 Tax=Virgibacillus halodenitrificans TaxID=1482 RepID=A0AAC9J298_VIRHA|nr:MULTISPECIES: stage III sporulation protein AD [Virgibacillus]AIF43464.1 stage III sporulation protein AD [Virgibacillus sp. SK37]APC48329.1 stage III sporulation protein AD [Virgibacillus halodenitrificans]MBD1222722.1 stage III sporulation protein AD [Virgibacillus halodenitrificans]MCG1029891.1 stage III sporulation protein AD [Virgibacillus halodenitrificans]MCJ0930894.1 stage III sporulation protein AD [Virgibacillus halodenitrificans]